MMASPQLDHCFKYVSMFYETTAGVYAMMRAGKFNLDPRSW